MPVYLAQTVCRQYFFTLCTQCALCYPLNSSLLWSPPQMDLIVLIKIRVSQHFGSLTCLTLKHLYSPFFSSPSAIIPPLHPLSLSLAFHSPHSSILHLYSSPCAPAPSLTQGPCVPVCNISKTVRQPGQGKQPSNGFRGDGGRDVFPQEPRDPRRLLVGPKEGLRGEDDPLSCPPRTHIGQSAVHILSSPFCLLPCHPSFCFCTCHFSASWHPETSMIVPCVPTLVFPSLALFR